MRKSRYPEEPIVGILKESEGGLPAAELCRKHGISEQTFYRWQAKYGGLEVSEMQRLRQLEKENSKLKQLVVEQALDIVGFKAVLSKTVVSPQARREAGSCSVLQRSVRNGMLWAVGSTACDVSLPSAGEALCRRQRSAARATA